MEKSYFTRRILETISSIVVSSIIIYILISIELAPNFGGSYAVTYAISMLIFFTITHICHVAHFRALRYNIDTYFRVNLSIFITLLTFNIIVLCLGSENLYTLFFAYTKFFSNLGFSELTSIILFYALYFLGIISVPIRALFI